MHRQAKINRAGGKAAVFNLSSGKDGVHEQLLKQARQSGQLNLSNRGFSVVPPEVWRINLDLPQESKVVALDNTEDRWWEQVDLTKLILASNSLRELSDDIKLLSALTVLDLHDNSLLTLPDSLSELSNIQRLTISHNKFSELPKCVYQLRKLVVLLANDNNITILNEDIRFLGDIEHLEVAQNKLCNIPKGIGFLCKLQKLDISKNQITSLPFEIGDLNALQSLDASSNELLSLPDTLGNLTHIHTLHLRHNRIASLPYFKLCKNLKELYIGNNNISEVKPCTLECLPTLVVLDMRDNKLSSLPDEITTLVNLERLDLTNNNLSELPYTLGTMNKLKFLVLEGNALRSIRRDIIQRGTIALKKYLCSRMSEVDIDAVANVRTMSGTSGIVGQVSYVDPFAVATTKKLDFSDKKVSVIPDDIWQIISDKDVSTIDFSKNQLSEWPPKLAICEDKLKDLNLGFNKLTSIPDNASCFIKLTYLDLRNNQLRGLPINLSSLQLLNCIILSFNRFSSIPSVLYELKKLENITMSDNQISELDVDGLSKLPNLSVLDVKNNSIACVPPLLGNMTQLRGLHLEGNAFKIPRPDVLAKGTNAVLEWLRDRIPV